MTNPDASGLDPEALKRQALECLAHLSSGQVTQADGDALRRWCAMDPTHARAFAEANLLWEVLGPAARNVAARPAAPLDMTQAMMGRRAFLGGSLVAASAAVAGYLTLRPPLDLWPSLPALMAQYRTKTGERRQLTVAGGGAVEMNTQTSLNIGKAAGGVDRIELIAGEAVVTVTEPTSKPVLVIAGDGQAGATQAKLDVRFDNAGVCVTCLEGSVDVKHRGTATVILAKQQVTYDAGGLGPVRAIDPVVVTSWRAGVLIFRGELLSRAVEEINRYRPGRIVLVDAALGRRRIDASFRLDHIEDVVQQIQRVFDARVTILPGGLVLLG